MESQMKSIARRERETAVNLRRRWSLQLERIDRADEEQFVSIEKFISIDQINEWSSVRGAKIRQLLRRKCVGFHPVQFFDVVAFGIEEKMYF